MSHHYGDDDLDHSTRAAMQNIVKREIEENKKLRAENDRFQAECGRLASANRAQYETIDKLEANNDALLERIGSMDRCISDRNAEVARLQQYREDADKYEVVLHAEIARLREALKQIESYKHSDDWSVHCLGVIISIASDALSHPVKTTP